MIDSWTFQIRKRRDAPHVDVWTSTEPLGDCLHKAGLYLVENRTHGNPRLIQAGGHAAGGKEVRIRSVMLGSDGFPVCQIDCNWTMAIEELQSPTMAAQGYEPKMLSVPKLDPFTAFLGALMGQAPTAPMPWLHPSKSPPTQGGRTPDPDLDIEHLKLPEFPKFLGESAGDPNMN